MEQVEDIKVIRKPDPTAKRKNIHVTTLNKIKAFLQEQISPVFKSEIVRNMGIDYNSLNLALTMITHKIDNEGKIFIKRKNGEQT